MTKAELIERIARSRDLPPGITKKDIALVLGIAFEELASYFAKARVTRTASPRFTFPRFGTFTKKRRSARRGVNPRTLEPIQIDACHTVDFKASRELRDLMNGTPAEVGTSGAKSKRTARATGKRNVKAVEEIPGPSRRRLTPRDEDAELDALIDDEGLFEEDGLPASRLKRVRKVPASSRERTTG